MINLDEYHVDSGINYFNDKRENFVVKTHARLTPGNLDEQLKKSTTWH